MNFVHIPKTGGSSIATALGIQQHQHAPASWTPRPRFTFVRHPLDRFISAWEFGRKRTRIKDAALTEKALRAQLDGPQPWMRDADGRIVITTDLTMRPQVNWVDAEMDFIGRFENLEEDFAKLSPAKLPHLNASERRAWQEYFTPPLFRIAVDYYLKDFETFGYPIEL